MKSLLLGLVLIYPVCLVAQVNESFADGDFTANPAWLGNSSDWIINAGQLQSNNMTANSSFYLSTVNTLAIGTQWEFYLRLNYNTSSANYADVFLTASAGDLTLNSTTGYFVRIGSTQDDICLYRKDPNGSLVKLIDGLDGATNVSNNTLKIKITRNSTNLFTLYRDVSGTGNSYTSEGSFTDATYTTSAFFGILVKQSTSSFFQKHFFDDIVVQAYSPDTTPPSVLSVIPTSSNNLDILFSEAIDPATSQLTANYSVNNGVGNPLNAQRDVNNSALIHLNFANDFPPGNNTLSTYGVQDISGNTMNTSNVNFSFYTAHQFDVVIDEIMADPSPGVLLPEAEFVELKNTSGEAINLSGWKLTTMSASSGAFPGFLLQPDSFVIVTSVSNSIQFNQYGKVIGIPAFPSIPNDGGLLTLISKEGKTIHAVEYDNEWYQNTFKNDGGWTLEMTDPHNPCSGKSNWKSSIDPRGGTPGTKNSVNGLNIDDSSPQLVRTFASDSVTIIAIFNEPLDSNSAAQTVNYNLTNHNVIAALPQPPLFHDVILRLSAPIEKGKVETLSVIGVTDCKGNTIGSSNSAKVGYAETALPNDMVINEVLFNPRPNAFDYVELYNRSHKILDGGQLFIANRNNGILGSSKKISEIPFLIFPGDYIVITEDAASLKTNYLVQDPQNVLILSSLPSFPDDKGTVVLANVAGEIVDQLSYEDDWHFALMSDDEGVSLERIDPEAVTQNKNNWHSAATTAGYGTPTYRNSQYKQADQINASFTITPTIFSPDNDGNDDVATIAYQLNEPGYVANISIFDAAGRIVRYLVKNELLGLRGVWNWDGLGEKMQKLPIGSYVIYTEIFNLDGKVKHFKNVVVLARKI